MKNILILSAVLAVLLPLGGGCAKSSHSEVPFCEDVAVEDANQPRPDMDNAVPSLAESKCVTAAKKLVKEAEEVLEAALREQKKPGDKAECLRHLAGLQGQVGDKETARKNFDRAMRIIFEEVEPKDRDGWIFNVTRSATAAGLEDIALKAAARIAEESNKANAYTPIINAQNARKDFAAAKKTAAESGQDVFYYLIARAEAAEGLFAEAKRTAETALERSPYMAVWGLASVAKSEAKSGDPQAAAVTLARAKEILNKAPVTGSKDQSYAKIAQVEAEAGMFDAVLKTLDKIKEGYDKYPVMLALAKKCCETGDKKRAAGFVKDAKKIVLKLQKVSRPRPLCEVAVVEAEVAGKEAAMETFEEAMDDVVTHWIGPGLEPLTLSYSNCSVIVRHMVEAGLDEEAEKYGMGLISTKPDPDLRRRNIVLGAIAETQARMGRFEQMRRTLVPVKNLNSLSMFNIVNTVLSAGATKYIPNLLGKLQPGPDDTIWWLINVGYLLARCNMEDRLADLYASLKDNSANDRLYFCAFTAAGYVQRIKDIRASGAGAARASSAAEAESMAEAKKWGKKSEELLEKVMQSDQSAYYKVNSLCEVAEIQAGIGKKEAAVKTLERAVKMADKEVKPDSRDYAFCNITGFAIRIGLRDFAGRTARMAKEQKYLAYRALFDYEIERGDLVAAKKVAAEAEQPYFYNLIAMIEASQGRFEEAKKTANTMVERYPTTTVRTLADIAALEAGAGKKEAAEKTFARAKDILRKVNNPGVYKDGDYAAIAAAEIKAGMLDAAVKTMEDVKLEVFRYPVLIQFARAYLELGDKKRAAEFLDKTKKSVLMVEQLDCASVLHVLCKIAVMQIEAVGREAALKTFQEAMGVFEKRTYRRADPMIIVGYMFSAGFPDEAEKFRERHVRSGNPRKNSDHNLAMKAEFQARNGHFDEAFKTAKLITKPASDNVCRIIMYYLDAGETSLMDEWIAILNKCDFEKPQQWPVVWMAWTYARAGYDKDLAARFLAAKDFSEHRRFSFCVSAAKGYLKRIEDMRAAGAKN